MSCAAGYSDPLMPRRRGIPRLQMFFADADPAIVGPLARRRVVELESRLEFLERDDLGGDRPHHRMVLAWGRAQTRSNLEFWRSIAEEAE